MFALLLGSPTCILCIHLRLLGQPVIAFCIVYCRQFEISRQDKYSTMSDEDLDAQVRQITHGNPSLGQRMVQGQLKSRGVIVQRWRVADSLIRVDEAAVAMRWAQVIHRRSYQVAGPNSLWHIDGNHKLIRFVIFQVFI